MADQAPVLADFRLHHALRVRWAEVDLQKIVFNPHYLAYVDTAIADYWRALALPYEDTLHRLGGDLFVKKSTLEFKASAHYDDRLTVALRCARIGNSSLQFLSSIFRGPDVLVTAELIYVFADPIAKTPQAVPQILRATMLAFEEGQPVVSTELTDWARAQVAVQTLRAPDGFDAAAQHCILRNALGDPIAVSRLRGDRQAPDGVAVMDCLRGARWGRAAAAALLEQPQSLPTGA